MADILVGIDLGTTVLKAAAFASRSGKRLASASQRLAMAVGADGRREQSPHALDRALSSVLGGLKERLGTGWRRVSGLGLAAQGGSFLIANRHTGRPLTPLILWNDQRAFEQRSAIARSRPLSFWRDRTWRDIPGAGLGRMRWLRESEPQLFNGRNIYAGAGEFLYHRLTGQWRQDPGNALQIGCYNVPGARLDPQLMMLADAPLDFVSPLRQGHESHPVSPSAARRFNLPADVPIVGPYMDHEAGYLSAAALSRRPLQCSLGTAWVGNFHLGPRARADNPVQLVMPSLTGQGWLVVQPLLTGNVTWDWALAQFVDPDHALALRKAVRIFDHTLLPARGLVALPWLNVANHSTGGIGAAALVGIGPHTTPPDMLRALAAGMACEMARVMAELKSRRKVDCLVLGGGASKGLHFQRLLAALFAPLPVYTVREEDLTGTRGALYALSPRAAAMPARPVGGPARKEAEGILDAYACYQEAFSRAYGDVPVGRPLRF